MLFSTALCLFLIFWSSTFLLDYFLRLRNWRPYVDIADRLGLVITPFQLRLYTGRSHEDILSASGSSNVAVSVFYGLGVVSAIASQIGITVYLSRIFFTDVLNWWGRLAQPSPSPSSSTVVSSLSGMAAGDGVDSDDSGLVPIVPGINLPFSHIPLFMSVLIVCAVVHEVGHAWCARSKGVTVNGFGLFVLGIYPGAFTDIDTNSLQSSSPWTRLQIFSAGVWHNLLLALFAYTLFLNASTLLSPLYTTGEGVMITDVNPSSGLYGPGGLQIGDVVIAIDDCQVRDSTSWSSCIKERRRSIDGKCVASEKLWMYASAKIEVSLNEVHCCPNVTVSHLCFESNVLHSSTANATTQRPPPLVELAGGVVLVAKKEEQEQREIYACLNARETLEGQSCNATSSCAGKGFRCAYPALFNGTKLVKLSVLNKRPVLFVGNINEMIHLVEHTPLSPRFTSFPFSLLAPSFLPTGLDLLAKYLLCFSLALGLLNALPCFALDGQFIIYTIVHSTLRSRLPKRRRSGLIRLLLCYGTLILIGNIVISFFRLYNSRMFYG